jgi:hypothetical protein
MNKDNSKIETDNRHHSKGSDNMNSTLQDQRYCSVKESITESFKEVKLMREGKKPKNSLDDLWKNIKQWEDENNNSGE